jgi:hypothetical protein
MGIGSMEMTHADPRTGVRYTLAFAAMGLSFRGEAAFDLEPQGEGTSVSWSSTMDLSSSRKTRALGPLIQRGMTQAFDEGLASLKREAERMK